MSTVVFDLLAPPAAVPEIEAGLRSCCEQLQVAGRFSEFELALGPSPVAGSEVATQLKEIYRTEHEDQELSGGEVYRASLRFRGLCGSLNELAMDLAHAVLTPRAKLPAEAALRENDALFEVPATYPWTVFVQR